MEDIAPSLLKQIEELYSQEKNSSEKIKQLTAKIKTGKISYIDAGEYADELGCILSSIYGSALTIDVLPDGKFYYNIAKRTVEPTMKGLQSDIADFTEEVQKHLNDVAKIGIKPIRPELNQDKIDGIIDRLSNAESFDDIAWILDEPIKTFARSVVDDAIEANAEFHGKSGMTPKIIRKSSGKCCAWCTNLVGTYKYPNVPDDVYHRHSKCKCTVDYVPSNGKKQNVWDKTWRDEVSADKIAQRKATPFGGDIKTDAKYMETLLHRELVEMAQKVNGGKSNKFAKMNKNQLITFILSKGK